MTSMTLRINSGVDKCAKKRKDIVEFQIKSRHRQQIKALLDDPDPPIVVRWLHECISSNDSIEHVTLIKKIGFSLQKSRIALTDHVTLVIEVLIDIYLQTECRHITKRAVASTLQGMPLGYLDIILQSFKEAVTNEIISVNGRRDVHFQRQLVENIMSCLENFNTGARCIAEMKVQILDFLLVTIRSFRKQFEMSACPTDSTKASLDCQMAIRTLIAVLKNAETNSSQLQFPITKEEEETTLKITLKHHVDSITEMLTNECYSLDCRCSCGIALPLLLTSPKYHRMTTPQRLLYSLISGSEDTKHILVSDATRNLLCSLNTVSKLCLFMGLLSVLKTDELIEEILSEKSLFFHVILPHILSSTKRERESAMTIVTSRAIFLWTKRAKEALEEKPKETTLCSRLKGDGDIACQLLEYVWTHWEHFIDCVRHTTRDIFDNTVLLHILSSDEVASKSPFVLWLTESLLKMSWDRRGKYGILCCLVHYVGAKTMLQLRPSLPTDLVTAMNDQSLLSQALELMETLFTYHKSEMKADSNEWEELWIGPIITMSSDKKSSSFQVEHILAKLLKCSPSSLSYIVSELVAFEAENSACNLRALLVTAKTARHLGLVNQFQSNRTETFLTWNQLLPGDLLKLALCHVDDEIRLDAFALLCDSPKTTEILQSMDLDLIRAFLPYNMTNQTPAFRQKLLAFVKKLLIRINDGGQTIKRHLEQMLKFDEDSKEIVPLQKTLTLYKDFLSWLCSKLFQSLYPGANFPRRGMALNILKLMHEIIGFQSFNIAETHLKPILQPHHIQTLLECLKDTYENNKTIALNILFSLSTEQLGFNDATRLSEMFEAGLQLASRSRPTDGVTAAYLFRLLSRHPPTVSVARSTMLALEEVGSQETSETQSPNIIAADEISPRFSDMRMFADGVCSSDIVFATLEVLTFQLMVELEMARGSLLEAAAHGPMYGVLFCIRSLLQDLDFGSLSGDKWRTYFATLIGICLDLGEVVSPIVNNASPEGHLPNATEPEEVAEISAHFQKILGLPIHDEETDETTSGLLYPSADLAVKTRAITAQKLLLCGWRTMKEVSLTLGDICQRSIEVLHKQIARTEKLSSLETPEGAAVILKIETDLVDIEHILQIGDYFITLLAETKHRGAFEQAYLGFCKVCDGLWRSKVSILHQLPEQWLQELLQHIEIGSGSSALCSTRRSAGLPFMVQALVSSEPHIKGSSCFKHAMQCLLQMVLSTSCTNDTKVHAFNILRALYRDTCLGDDVTPFIADGLEAAILGFKGETWGVRNSATLLFSTLVTRIFGVQRSKDELSRKNCMTGSVFFQRFPSLYQFFTEELKKATSQVDKNYLTMQPCLYPVLLILARLYPSSIEGTQSSLKLSVFIPYVMKCGTSPSVKTRNLAAKGLVPLVPFMDVASILFKLFESLPNETENIRQIEQNVLHGKLLQIFHLLTEIPNISSATFGKEPLFKFLHTFLLHNLWICTRINPCPVTRACFVNILDASLTLEIWNLNDSLQETILKFVDLELSDPNISTNVPGIEVFQMSIARLAIRLTTAQINNNEAAIIKRIIQLLCHGAYEVRWTILNFLYTVLTSQSSSDHANIASMIDSKDVAEILLPEPSIPSQEWTFLHGVDINWVTNVKNSEELTTVLVTMATTTEQHPDCIVQLYHLLPLFPKTFELPWTCVQAQKWPTTATEKFELILQKGECEPRDDIRSSLLHFTGFLIPNVYDELTGIKSDVASLHSVCADPHSVIKEWIEAFFLCCSPEQSLRVRLTATKLLISNGHILLIDPAKCLGFSCLSVWSSAVLLLQDDDPVIKPLASNLVEICSHQNLLKNAIQPALALDILIGQFVNHFGGYAQSECLTTILDWMLIQDVQESNYILEEEDRMFDRGQMNIYAEEINFTILLRKHFKLLLRRIFQVKMTEAPQEGGNDDKEKRKEVRNQMLASLGRRTSKSMLDPLLPQSFTLDIGTLQVMSEKFKDIMGSFKVTSNQVSTWLSEEQRDDLGSRDSTRSHVFLQDVIDMVVEELSLVLRDADVMTDQTAFVSRSFDQTIVRLYRLVTTVYCLCKYDNAQKDVLQKILDIMEEKFGTVNFQNQLVFNFVRDMKKLCLFHNETI